MVLRVQGSVWEMAWSVVSVSLLFPHIWQVGRNGVQEGLQRMVFGDDLAVNRQCLFVSSHQSQALFQAFSSSGKWW